MTKVNELRQMSDEQLQLTAKETAESFFGFVSKRRPNGSMSLAKSARAGD